MKQDQYIMLMASLPPHAPDLFTAKQPPISRIKLNQRLTMLEPEHREKLDLIENLVHWDRLAIATSDDQIIQRGKQTLNAINNDLMKKIISWRLEKRSMVAALRRKQLDLSAPEPGQKWGFGERCETLVQHWAEPAFGLQRQFPWLEEAERLMNTGKHLDLERMLLHQVWVFYDRLSSHHFFDFEAVIIYVLRWDVIDRWSRYDDEKAAARLQSMSDSGLGEFKTLFPETLGEEQTAYG